MVVLLSGIVGALPANAAPYIGAPSAIVNTVDITFDTNLPKSGTPYTPSGADSPYSGEISSILTVDGVKVGYLIVQNSKGTFQGPITFTWDVGSTHTYSWESTVTFENLKRFSFNSASGVASGQSGTIIVSSGGTITANYKDEVLLSIFVRDSSGNECSSCGTISTQSGWYAVGTTVQLQSTPFEGHTFQKSVVASSYVGVQGPQPSAETSTQNPKTITMDNAKTAIIFFQPLPTPTPTPTPKPTPTPQSTKSLLYENKQYGFSIKYPSNWSKQETLQKDPNSNFIAIVNFAPSQLTTYGIGFSANDPSYKGLSEKQFLEKMKKQVNDMCSAATSQGVICSDITASRDTHPNGYTTYGIYYSASGTSEQGAVNVVEATVYIPDGNNIWSIQLFSFSPTELEQIMTDIGSSLDTFTIYNYQGIKKTIQSSTQQTTESSTIAKSSVGLLQINSGEFAVSKYSTSEVIVSGQINDYKKGTPLILKIVKPNKSVEEQNILVGKDGNFKMPIRLDSNWSAGTYQISAKYGSANLGAVSFQIKTGDVKTSTTQTPLLTQKQFSLNIKATQKNDVLEISVQNPADSSKIVYGIKLTMTNGKITNFLKLDGWEHKRINDKTVTYQTKSSPLDPAETIKIKLKVDSKKTEFSWEAFSKDQKSLGTGKVKT